MNPDRIRLAKAGIVLTLLLAVALIAAGCVTTSAEVAESVTPAPDFQLLNLDGQTVSLSDFRGKPVMLNFWATWCGPCRAEMPYIQQVYDERSDDGLVVLAINIGESLAKVKGFMQDYGLTFPVLLDIQTEVAKQYNIQVIPTTFFIDPDGGIQDVGIGAFPNKAAIETRLGKIIP